MATSYCPVVDRSSDQHVAAEIDIEEIQEARLDPAVRSLLEQAAAEGQRVEREGRQRW